MPELLRRLAELEADAEQFYLRLANHTDMPWVREFALRLAREEQGHRQHFLDYAGQLEASEDESARRLESALTGELKQMLSVQLLLPARGVEKTAVYLSEKDAVQVAIQAERNAVALLTQLRAHVPAAQHRHLDRVIVEEKRHQAMLQELYKKHFGSEQTR